MEGPAGLFEAPQVRLEMLGRGPGVGEPLGVMVLEDPAALLGDDIEIVQDVGEAPGEDERKRDLLARGQSRGQTKGPDVGPLVGRGRDFVQVLEPAVGGEIVPEDLKVVPPIAADPVGEVGDVGPGRRQGHRPEGGRVGFDLPRGHGQAAEGRRSLDLVDVLAELVVPEAVDLAFAGVADRVDDRAGDGDLGRGGTRVLDPVAKDEGRDAGVVGLERDEGIERFEGDLERHLAIGEFDLGERIFALERGLLHPRQTGDEDAAEAEAGRERRLERTFEDADELLPGLLDVEGEEGEGHVDALAGPVEDLPVAEVAAAAEGDRPGADAAEREGDLVEGPPFERPDRPGGEELVAAGGGRLRRPGARGPGEEHRQKQDPKKHVTGLSSEGMGRHGEPPRGRVGTYTLSF